MSARALCLALLLAACQRPAPTQPAPLAVASHGADHADPSPPFALTVTTHPIGDTVADVKVRLTPTLDLPSVTLGADLSQPLTRESGDAQRTFTHAVAGAPLEFTVRVRRTTPGAAGVTLRAWAEARSAGVVLGDEREVTLFGAPPATQPSVRERTVRAADGSLLHDTIVE